MMNFTRVLCLMMTMMIRLVMQNRVHVLSAKGAGASREQNSGCPEKPNTKGMSKKGADEALHKWQKSQKHEKDYKDRRKNARKIDETIMYTGVVLDLLQPTTEVR